jgi:hypothetical protein
MNYRIILPLLLALFLSSITLAHAGKQDIPKPKVIAGEYTVKGWDPGNHCSGAPDYTGTVNLDKWGDAYTYRGTIDGQIYAGAALYDATCGAMSLSFANVDGTERGVTLLKYDGSKFRGVWLMDTGSDGSLGSEVWIRKQ